MMRSCCLILVGALPCAGAAWPVEDGYRGIWYFNQPSKDEYKFKYSGGLGTYPQQHIPIAWYSKEADKTFFCYGGTTARQSSDKQELLHLISYYDHATGTVPRPTLLLNKQTDDAHDNPTLALDDAGYIWIFSPSHGTARPAYIHRSTRPFSIDAFERVLQANFSYPQAWHLPGHGFLFLHTRYRAVRPGLSGIRRLHWMSSPDGRLWTEPQLLADIELGNYQISWRHGDRVGTAFDFHPQPIGLNARANIYYLETDDLGRTWRTVDGRRVQPPLTNARNPALVYDSRAANLLVYLKDLNFDHEGRPVILFLTSSGYEAGPANDPRTWRTARWTGQDWEFQTVTTSLNNYDHGSLYLQPDGLWRVIAPTDPGPQPYNPGGEMVLWTSRDQGRTWTKKILTADSPFNHTYARRPVQAHPDFFAFWADGHARQPSQSRFYFTDRDGRGVWRLPEQMSEAMTRPEALAVPGPRR